MTTHPPHVAQILSDYELMEPGESDAWNPLRSDFELTYRLGLLYALRKALTLIDVPIESMTVLDFGCGNGRSTRMYIDLGFRPEQLTGLDLRPGAIELAKKLNPALRYVIYDGQSIPYGRQSVTWISLNTVLSSIKSHEGRAYLANQVYETLEPGGYLFYYDLVRANRFAGHDRMHPVMLFSSLKKLWHRSFKSYQFIPAGERLRSFLKGLVTEDKKEIYWLLLRSLARRVGASHEVLLAQKILG